MRLKSVFSIILVNAGVWNGVSAFCKSSDNTENPVHVFTGRQPGGLYDEPGWLRTSQPHTASRY